MVLPQPGSGDGDEVAWRDLEVQVLDDERIDGAIAKRDRREPHRALKAEMLHRLDARLRLGRDDVAEPFEMET